eukprot:gb/GECG01009422.1/.p1 GENE.gb/GECG01009422.1/~~gb/GECG01009422.1/.p1  ORF type:complete len:399 (+),score=35.31 gb/GECG01009422.1/:1-1197(+)
MAYSAINNVWTWALAFIFLALLLWAVYQLWKIVKEKHRLSSFHGIFLCIGLLWLPFRVFIFFSSHKDTASWEEIFYLLPTSLQFTDFALWVIFFANIEHSSPRVSALNTRFAPKMEPLLDINTSTSTHISRHAQQSKRNYIVFSLVMVVLYLVDFVVIGLTLAQNQANLRHVMHSLQHGYSSVCYLTLACLLFFFAVRFSRLTPMEYSSLVLPRSPRTLVSLTLVLTFLFFLHSLYDILFIAEVLDLTTFPPIRYETFLFFTILEAFPMGISLSLTSHIPSSGGSSSVDKASGQKGDLEQRYRDVRVGDYFHDYESEGSVSRMSQRSFEGVNGLYPMDDLDSYRGRNSSGTKDGSMSIDATQWEADNNGSTTPGMGNDLSEEDISFAKEAAKAFGRNS